MNLKRLVSPAPLAVGVVAGVIVGGLASRALFTSPAIAEHAGQQAGHSQRSEHWQPVDAMHLYLCAFHVAKMNPNFQVEAHHFCSPQSSDLHQCVVYDGKGPGAKLLGTEYIIPDAVYRTLPEEEKKYWHPHAYEILSGQLIAPDLPNMGDDVFPGLITTWGKTWHTWPDPSQPLPLGEPLLMWSANGDGQVNQKLIDARDAQFGISTDEIRKRRGVYGYAVPNIPPPKSINDRGRIWTATGPDEPTMTKKE